MKQLKKFSMRSVSEFLTEPEMKRVVGGYTGWCCTYQNGIDWGCVLTGCTSDAACVTLYGAGSKCD